MYTCTVEMLESIQNSFIPPLFSIHDLAQGFSAKRGGDSGKSVNAAQGISRIEKPLFPTTTRERGEQREKASSSSSSSD